MHAIPPVEKEFPVQDEKSPIMLFVTRCVDVLDWLIADSSSNDMGFRLIQLIELYSDATGRGGLATIQRAYYVFFYCCVIVFILMKWELTN